MPLHTSRGRKPAIVSLVAIALTVAACGSDNNAASGVTSSVAPATVAAPSTDSAAVTTAAPDTTAAVATTTASDPLGTPNAATGTPIKIGVVADGKTEAIDNSQAIPTVEAVASYTNDYLGGVNGHPLEVSSCETGGTPSGATTCAVQMVNDKVAAVVVGSIAQDGVFFTTLTESGIPYVTATSATGEIITSPAASVLTNPIAAIGAPIPLAQEEGVDHLAFVIIDVPAATGPIAALATPLYQKAGLTLDLVNISPQVADMTPQIQQAMSQGVQLFTIAGTDEFIANAIRAMKQLGFTGTIVASLSAPSPDLVATIPGGLEGVVSYSSITDDPADPDLQQYNAIMDKYSKDTDRTGAAKLGYVAALGLVRALTGVDTAVDAASISKALGSMPAPVDTPLGGGLTFQCGNGAVAFAPAICTTQLLKSTLDKDGAAVSHEVVDVGQFLKLG